MYIDILKCIVCGKETKFSIKTKFTEASGMDYSIVNNNNDKTFRCEIDIICEHCEATQRIFRDIEFKA